MLLKNYILRGATKRTCTHGDFMFGRWWFHYSDGSTESVGAPRTVERRP